eukprot:11154977-Lingulodinium_polyedra.AAC.1
MIIGGKNSGHHTLAAGDRNGKWPTLNAPLPRCPHATHTLSASNALALARGRAALHERPARVPTRRQIQR